MHSPGLSKVREAFDRIALSIDDLRSKNPIGLWTRHANLTTIRSSFPPQSCLLELGCGTGEDAIALAKSGHRIFAIDISEAMVATARAKTLSQGVADLVVVVCGRSADLTDLVKASPWKSFDGAYANFSLTYEESLGRLAESVHDVLAPSGFFICTLPNRLALSEVVFNGLGLKFRKVLWRLKEPLIHEVYGHEVRIHAYWPWQVRKAFEGLFALRELKGLPLLLPPVYLHGLYSRLGSGRSLLERLDSALAGKFPWNRFGENTMFKFQRREA